MKIHFERPIACRLYSALGLLIWLHSAVEAAADTEEATADEQKLEALAVCMSNLESEVGLIRLNLMQDEVYCALTEPHRQ